MKRTYRIQRRGFGEVAWLYDWAKGPDGEPTYPVWTHDKSKALILDAYDSAKAVRRAENLGVLAGRVPIR